MKKFSKIFWNVTQGPWYYRFMKKTRGQKSHATVPLTPYPIEQNLILVNRKTDKNEFNKNLKINKKNNPIHNLKRDEFGQHTLNLLKLA